MSASVKFRDVFTMSKLNSAWERAARDELGFNVDSLNLTNFRKFMVEEFQCPQRASRGGVWGCSVCNTVWVWLVCSLQRG